MEIETLGPIVPLILDMLVAHPEWSREEVAYHLVVLLVRCPSDEALHFVNVTCDWLNDTRVSAESRKILGG